MYKPEMPVIPVRLSEDEVKQIDLLVKKAGYPNRSRAIRGILKDHLLEKLSLDEDVSDIVESLLELKRRGEEPVKLHAKKSITRLVAEGRA